MGHVLSHAGTLHAGFSCKQWRIRVGIVRNWVAFLRLYTVSKADEF